MRTGDEPDVPAKVWSRAARFYDLQLPLEWPALDAAVELADAGPDDRLIDIATGTGGLLRRLTRAPVVPDRAVGVDASEAMLERAPAMRPGWALRRADARALPFADASFDVATACYLLHLLAPTSRHQMLREMARVLRLGGRLVVVTPSEPRSRVGRALATPILALASRSSGPLAGLRPLDPTDSLAEAGFAIRCVRRAASIPVSTCVLAERRAFAPGTSSVPI
jgi:ubiquinone/menaquinone biosynthesis C-methylase UbiE